MITRVSFLLMLILFSCKAKYAGTIPMYMDEFILITKERSFQLENSLTGTLIHFQESYDCTNDSIEYNSTSLVKLMDGDTITVYSPCLQKQFKPGSFVTIEKTDLNGKTIQQTKREIIEQFPRRHASFPYWECISCKYPNTVGIIKTR